MNQSHTTKKNDKKVDLLHVHDGKKNPASINYLPLYFFFFFFSATESVTLFSSLIVIVMKIQRWSYYIIDISWILLSRGFLTRSNTKKFKIPPTFPMKNRWIFRLNESTVMDTILKNESSPVLFQYILIFLTNYYQYCWHAPYDCFKANSIRKLWPLTVVLTCTMGTGELLLCTPTCILLPFADKLLLIFPAKTEN